MHSLPTRLQSLALGAALYVPALNSRLDDVVNGRRYSNLRTVIVCTEDSVAERDVPEALAAVSSLLERMEPAPVNRFVRPRNPGVLATILAMKGCEALDGFVLPKADRETMPAYFELLSRHERFVFMPTLETGVVFDLPELYRLRDWLASSPLAGRIPALRIGALDILSFLDLRREARDTIYETPLGHVMDQLITVFKPAGFALTASGFECFAARDVLARELQGDVARGLFGKTALHPDQIDAIHRSYMVTPGELETAAAIADPERPAVFRFRDRMCEKAVHRNWADAILARSAIYGVASREVSDDT